MDNKNKLCIKPDSKNIDLDKWLLDLHSEITKIGYTKHNKHINSESFSYFKTFRDDNHNKIYQIGVLIYDCREYGSIMHENNRVGIEFHCYLLQQEGRFDLSVSHNISIGEFEEMALSFYKSITQYLQ